MSSIQPIQPQLPNLISEVPAPSFAEALAMIPTWELTPTRTRDWCSALRIVSRMLNLPPSAIPCCTQWLNEHLFQRPPTAFGFGAKHMQATLSRLRAVLAHLGRHQRRPNTLEGLDREWLALLDVLPDGPQRAGLHGLARFCTSRDIPITKVTTEVLADYLAADVQARLAASTTKQGASLARAWNDVVARQADPGRYNRVAAPPRRVPYTKNLSEFPEVFQRDVEAFRASIAQNTGSGTFSAKGGARKRLRPVSVAMRSFSIRQAASALVITGTDIDSIKSLADLVQPIEHAARILDFYHQRGGGKEGSQLASIAEVLRQIGKFHVCLSGPDMDQLTDWRRRADGPRESGIRGKARRRVEAMAAPRARAMLLRLPVELMRRAKLPDTTPREAARLARMAVMVEILSVCPIRLASLRAIRIDHSLLRLGNHGRLASHLRIEAADTKTGQEVQWPLPLESAKLLETYIIHHRPSLVPDANRYLFPGEGLEPLSHNGLRESLGRTIDRLIGITVTPHLFRHFAAYNFLTTNPGQYELVRRVLGHASVETTIANYCGLEADAAAKVFDDMLLRQRRETRSIADAAFRRGRGGKAGRS